MGLKNLRQLRETAILKADETHNEETTAWCNRDLIPLPPSRRTWGWFNFFGAGSLGALNVATWQTPNTLLTQGLSVGQAMAIIIISRAVVCLFSCIIAWCGLTWHVGFTIQNRFTWGLRGAYIPLIQRSLLNFIWCAIQAWNGGRLVTYVSQICTYDCLAHYSVGSWLTKWQRVYHGDLALIPECP